MIQGDFLKLKEITPDLEIPRCLTTSFRVMQKL